MVEISTPASAANESSIIRFTVHLLALPVCGYSTNEHNAGACLGKPPIVARHTTALKSYGRVAGGTVYFLSIPFILQVLLIIHVVRNGRDRIWIFVLIFLPLAGGIAYLAVEVIPDIVRGRAVRTAASSVSNIVAPDRRLRELEEQVKYSPTVANRSGLADELFARGRYQEAIDLYVECLTGPFDQDEIIILHLARAYFASGQLDEVLATLDRLKSGPSEPARANYALIRARALEGLERREEAEESYRESAAAGFGLEHRYRLAAFLNSAGKTEEAGRIYEDILDTYRRTPAKFKREAREWAQRAEADLRAARG
jgi:hypothetical protein